MYPVMNSIATFCGDFKYILLCVVGVKDIQHHWITEMRILTIVSFSARTSPSPSPGDPALNNQAGGFVTLPEI